MRLRNNCEAELFLEWPNTTKGTKGVVDDGDEFPANLGSCIDDDLDLSLHRIANDGNDLGLDDVDYLPSSCSWAALVGGQAI